MRLVAIITGASSGIGSAIARELAGQGYAVVLAARSVATLEQLAHDIGRQGGEALVAPTDVTQLEQVTALVRRTQEHYGRIDVLINNAGIGARHWAWAATDDEIQAVIATDLLGPIWLMRAVIPILRGQRRGHIVNIASVAAHIGVPTSSVYTASKFGLRGYTDSLRRELHGSGVAVSLISPGFIHTPMTREIRGVPMPGPEAVARAVTRVLRRPRREVVVPGWYRPLIWLATAFPGLTDWLVARAYWLGAWPAGH